MSTCPSNDIHSVYLDDELPTAYIAEYEAHVNSCAQCSAALKKMRSIRNALKAEAAALTPDSHYLEQSWERLQIRKSYSAVTKQSSPFPDYNFKYIAIAASAVFLIALIPLKLLRAPRALQAQTALAPIARNGTVVLSKDNVVINGNLKQFDMFAPPLSPEARTRSLTKYNGAFPARGAEHASAEKSHRDYDVFRPNFDKEHAITIKINIPAIGAPYLISNVDMASTQFASAPQ